MLCSIIAKYLTHGATKIFLTSDQGVNNLTIIQSYERKFRGRNETNKYLDLVCTS